MIELLSPWGLLAAVSIPVLVALHSLRPRRTDATVSTSYLWREALRDRQRGLGLQRLLRDLGLVLLIAAAAALSLALAQPVWFTEAFGKRETVLIIDTSASMQTREDGRTRFERARARALSIVGSQSDRARTLVMTSAAHPVLRSAFESDRERLREVLRALEVTDEAGRPREAVEAAVRLLHDHNTGRVVFLTDGAFDADVELGGRVTVERFGEGRTPSNVAITRFDFRPEIGSTERYQLLLRLRNYTGSPVPVPVSVSLEGRTLLEREIVLAANRAETLIVPFTGRDAGRAEAHIDVQDDLAADNRAYAVLPGDEPLRVLLFGAESLFIESALAALPNVEVHRLEAFEADRYHVQQLTHDLVIFYQIPPPELGPGRYLLIDTLPPGLPFSSRGWVDHPVITGRGASALISGIDLSGVKVERARRLKLHGSPPGLQRLFWSAETELALAYLEEDRRLVYLGFDVADSTFPLQASFPLFLQAALDWLGPRSSRHAETQVAAGEPVSFVVPPGGGEIAVHTPGGTAVLDGRAGSTRFEHTSKAGIYRYEIGGRSQYFAVNLTDEAESYLVGRAPKAVPRSSDNERNGTDRIGLALWPHLCVLALLLLASEAFVRWRAARA